mmetsp:Transcript_55742/g.158283  ORF Transcript_55742/g.158283 Transcript_55742/m.158283 type:complete len:262 (+) Transcript_55742:113-898(+)
MRQAVVHGDYCPLPRRGTRHDEILRDDPLPGLHCLHNLLEVGSVLHDPAQLQHHELPALSSRLGVLPDEVVFVPAPIILARILLHAVAVVANPGVDPDLPGMEDGLHERFASLHECHHQGDLPQQVDINGGQVHVSPVDDGAVGHGRHDSGAAADSLGDAELVPGIAQNHGLQGKLRAVQDIYPAHQLLAELWVQRLNLVLEPLVQQFRVEHVPLHRCFISGKKLTESISDLQGKIPPTLSRWIIEVQLEALDAGGGGDHG